MDSNASLPLLYRLPNELLLCLFRQCSDISTVWALLNTSARLRHVFLIDPKGVVQDVLLAAGVPPDTRKLMNAVLHLHREPFLLPPRSKPRKISPPPVEFTMPASYADAFARASASDLLQFVALAHRIHVLTHATLNHCRPALVAAEAQTPQGGPSKADRPPSWLEEEQALSAFWKLQLLSDVALAILDGRMVRTPAGLPTVVLNTNVNIHRTRKALGQLQWEAGGRRDDALLTLSQRGKILPMPHGRLATILTLSSFRAHWPDHIPVKISTSPQDTLWAFNRILYRWNAISDLFLGQDEAAPTPEARGLHPEDPNHAKVALYWILHDLREATRLPVLPLNRLGWSCAPNPEQPPPAA